MKVRATTAFIEGQPEPFPAVPWATGDERDISEERAVGLLNAGHVEPVREEPETAMAPKSGEQAVSRAKGRDSKPAKGVVEE